MFKQIIAEVVQLARAEGVPLADDVVQQQIEFAAGLPPDAYSSLHHDLVTGTRMELEALHDTMAGRAAHHGIAAPANEAIYAILRPSALHNEGDPG